MLRHRQGQEGLAGLAARDEILALDAEAVATFAGDQIKLVADTACARQSLPPSQIDQRGGRHAIALAAGNVGGAGME